MSRNNYKPLFDEVMDRLKKEFGLKSDTELALLLGMERNALYYRRFTDSLPWKNIIELCCTHKISIDGIIGDCFN